MVTRLSGGLTPADGADPRTFPAIWNTTAGEIETAQADIAQLQAEGASTTISDTPPVDPGNGDLWWDSTDGSFYVWYEDVDGSQWVGIRAASSSASIDVNDVEPGSPLTGNLWWNTDVESGKSLSVYNGSSWVNAQPLSGNAIINGDFGVWQRGTSFTGSGYSADRFSFVSSSATPTTNSVTQETFTPGSIEAIGYGNAQFFIRSEITTLGSATAPRIEHKIEDVNTLAGQTVTLSFWAKSVNSNSGSIRFAQSFGSGGSAKTVSFSDTFSMTSSWQRFSFTGTLDSVSGKTVGSGSLLELRIYQESVDGSVIDLWGVQLEAGGVATPFRLAGGGSKAAELALCQRYYYKVTTDAAFKYIGTGFYESSSSMLIYHHFPVTMRTVPTLEATSGTNYYRLRPADYVDSISSTGTTLNAGGFFNNTQASGTAGNAGRFTTESSSASVAWRAEL